LDKLRYFIHAYGKHGPVFDPDGIFFATAEQAVAEILSTLRELVLEMVADGEPVPFQSVHVTDERGLLIKNFTAAELRPGKTEDAPHDGFNLQK